MSPTHPFGQFFSVDSRTILGVYPKGHAREGRVMTLRSAGCKAHP